MQLKQGINLGAELIAVASGFINYKKLDKKFLFLFYFVLFAFLTEISLNVLHDVFDFNNNLSLLHFYIPVEFLLLSLIYYWCLGRFYGKYFMVTAIVGFEIYCIINPLIFQGLNEYSNTRSIGGLLLILFSILYFYKLLAEAKIKSLINEPMIWLNIAVLFYFSGNLFFNLLFSFILDYSREFSKISTWYFGGLNVLFYLLIAVGFWKAGRQKKV